MLRGWRAWHSRAKALTLWTLARSSGKTSTCSAETFFALFSLVERILFLSPPERISCRDASPRLSSRQPMTTVAPSDMSLLATALPIPEVAPVMTTVAPLRSRRWCCGSFGRCCSRYQALAPRATAGTPTMVAPAARRSRGHMVCVLFFRVAVGGARGGARNWRFVLTTYVLALAAGASGLSGLFTTVFGPSYSVMTQYAGSSLLSPDEVRGVFQGSLPCGGQNRLAPPLLSGAVVRWKCPRRSHFVPPLSAGSASPGRRDDVHVRDGGVRAAPRGASRPRHGASPSCSGAHV